MAKKLKIQEGDYIRIRDGRHENMLIQEGRIVQISDVAGTNNKRIHCETPFLIDVIR